MFNRIPRNGTSALRASLKFANQMEKKRQGPTFFDFNSPAVSERQFGDASREAADVVASEYVDFIKSPAGKKNNNEDKVKAWLISNARDPIGILERIQVKLDAKA